MREVLQDADLAVPIALIHEGGAETVTSGVVGRAPTGVDELQAPSRLSAWVPTPSRTERVQRVRVSRPDGAADIYRALEIEPTTGALYGNAMSETTEYLLRFDETAGLSVDFDPADFDTADFA